MNNIVTNIEGVKYPNKYYWNKSINPYCSIGGGLADCTTLVYGALVQAKIKPCVRVVTDARNWHLNLVNGWVAMPYEDYKDNIKVGDVIEWEAGNHVAIVSNIDKEVWISGSFYTGINGKAYSNGGYDTREGIETLEQLNDFMLANYEYRYFHYVPLETEAKWCGGVPQWVLVCPTAITPTAKNNTLEQIYVGVKGLRVRTQPNLSANIVGEASVGYYDVESSVIGGAYEEGNIWYKLGDYYVAGVKGVIHYPVEQLAPLDEMLKLMSKLQDAYNALYNENKELKAKLERIKELI